jgi:hypothetical protein
VRRERMIEALVTDSMVRILDRQHACWLSEILESGFTGFGRMSDPDLRKEMARRGLAADDNGDNVMLNIAEDDGPHDDDPDLRGLLRGRLDDADRHEHAFEST